MLCGEQINALAIFSLESKGANWTQPRAADF